jgi:phospho-N-acetylmuramoyl-pentapeptide-transferase
VTMLLIVCPAAAILLMLLLMPRFLPYLKKMKFGQTIYSLGPKAHQTKQGTPNMGGILIGGITVLATLAAAVFSEEIRAAWPGILAILFVSLGSMAIGFADDYIKDIKKRHEGLKPRQKIAGQIVVGFLFSWYCYRSAGSAVAIPFSGAQWDLGIFYIPLMTLLVIFITNSANLQDGADGLLSSVTVIGMAAWGVIAILLSAAAPAAGSPPYLAVFCFSLMGACVGFLFFNRYPAKIMMGDTGSMFIGGAMVGTAMLLKAEFLLIPIGFTCIMSSVSVMMQVTYFKLTHGKRIFRMSPIHHHFELGGMSENQIVLMYAGVTLVLSVIAVLSAC